MKEDNNIEFVPTHHILIQNWFALLAKQAEKREHGEKREIIFEVDHPNPEYPGRYFAIFAEDEVPLILNPKRVSFSEILHYSEKFIPILDRFFDQLDLNADQNNLGYLVKTWNTLTLDASNGLNELRNQVIINRFKGKWGWFFRVLSTFTNLYEKYLDYSSSGLYWPGNHNEYTIKIVSRFSFIRRKFLKRAHRLNEELLKKDLNLPDNQEIDFSNVKKAYRNKMKLIHPDKDVNFYEDAIRTNTIYDDYLLLMQLNQND